jgi:phenylacetate-CoA ligase
MPILRYRVGDRGAMLDDACSCGQSGPRLVEFAGRTLDLLVARDGRLVGSAWLGVWRAHAADVLNDFRIVQEAQDRLRFQWVPGRAFRLEALDEIRLLMREHLGDIEIIEECVSELAREPSGKCRRVYRTFELSDR